MINFVYVGLKCIRGRTSDAFYMSNNISKFFIGVSNPLQIDLFAGGLPMASWRGIKGIPYVDGMLTLWLK